jgi:hypothetical protein
MECQGLEKLKIMRLGARRAGFGLESSDIWE